MITIAAYKEIHRFQTQGMDTENEGEVLWIRGSMICSHPSVSLIPSQMTTELSITGHNNAFCLIICLCKGYHQTFWYLKSWHSDFQTPSSWLLPPPTLSILTSRRAIFLTILSSSLSRNFLMATSWPVSLWRHLSTIP